MIWATFWTQKIFWGFKRLIGENKKYNYHKQQETKRGI